MSFIEIAEQLNKEKADIILIHAFKEYYIYF